MKKLALTLTVTLACVAAFAQGKVSFRNDSLHLVYFATSLQAGQGLLAGDVAGAVATQATGLSVDLFAGTSQATMTKLSTTTMAASPGTFGPVSITLPFAAGAGQFFDIQVYSTAAGSYAAAFAGKDLYYGDTGVFTATSSGTISPNSLCVTGSPSFSTWAVGTTQVTGVAGGMGALSIAANTVPEPTSLALLGLGAAGMLIFRRRK